MLPANAGASGRRVQAFTLIEILALISIIGILAVLVFPIFTRARINRQMTSCASNLHQAALALSVYQQDFDSLPPFVLTKEGNYSWAAVQPYLKSTLVTRCPYSWRNDQGIYCTAKWQLHGHPRALNTNTVLAYCVQHLDRADNNGIVLDKGFYMAVFGDGSARRIDARQTSRWLFKSGNWMLEREAQMSWQARGKVRAKPEPWVETRFPGEPWPPE